MEYETAYMREAGGNDHHHQPAQCIAIELEQLSYTHTQIHIRTWAANNVWIECVALKSAVKKKPEVNMIEKNTRTGVGII